MTETNRSNEIAPITSSGADREFTSLVQQVLKEFDNVLPRSGSSPSLIGGGAEAEAMRCCHIVEPEKPAVFGCAHLIQPEQKPSEPFRCAHRILPDEHQKQPEMFHCAHEIKPGEHPKLPEMFQCANTITPGEKPNQPELYACAHTITLPGERLI